MPEESPQEQEGREASARALTVTLNLCQLHHYVPGPGARAECQRLDTSWRTPGASLLVGAALAARTPPGPALGRQRTESSTHTASSSCAAADCGGLVSAERVLGWAKPFLTTQRPQQGDASCLGSSPPAPSACPA